MPWKDTPENRAKKRAQEARYYAAHPGYKAAYYAANRERVAAKRATPEEREKRRLHAAQERLRRPMQREAVKQLNLAVHRGALVRQPCEICGSTENIEGHHAFGYEPEFALAVWWLCVPHHSGVHVAMRGVTL